MGYNIVFVSSGTYDGDLGGPSGADSKCADLAAPVPALAGKQWRAWVSDGNGDAKDRIADEEYRLVDGTTKVVDDLADLIDGDGLDHAIDKDESGAAATGGAWTGTDQFGEHRSSYSCSLWDVDTALTVGGTGNVELSGISWTYTGSGTCDSSYRIYCFEWTP